MAATPCVGRHAGLDSGTYKTLVSLVTGVCRCLISCVHSTSISTVHVPPCVVSARTHRTNALSTQNSNAENVSIWWRHHGADLDVLTVRCKCTDIFVWETKYMATFPANACVFNTAIISSSGYLPLLCVSSLCLFDILSYPCLRLPGSLWYCVAWFSSFSSTKHP